MNSSSMPDDAIIAATRRWVDRAVIGLNLCPFAKGVQSKDRKSTRLNSSHSGESRMPSSA